MRSFIKELGKVEIDYFYGESEDKINFKTYIKSVEDSFILLDILTYNNAEYNIPTGKAVSAKFKTKDGVYAGISNVIGRDNNPRLPGIRISYPKEVEFIQQREYVRVPLNLEVSLVVSQESESTMLFDLKTFDISGSGFSTLFDQPFEKHSQIMGIINFSITQQPPVEISLLHVHSRPVIVNGKQKYKTAFKYFKINEKTREKILKEIFLYELQMLKKGIG